MGKVILILERACMAIAITAVAVMMAIISYDALSRYLFNAPLPWAFQVVSYYLLGVALFLAVSATFSASDHINIDLFSAKMPVRLRNWIDVVWGLMMVIVFSILAIAAWKSMMTAWNRNSFLPGHISWPAWISHLPIVLGAGLMSLRLLNHCYRLARSGADPDVAVVGEATD